MTYVRDCTQPSLAGLFTQLVHVPALTCRAILTRPLSGLPLYPRLPRPYGRRSLRSGRLKPSPLTNAEYRGQCRAKPPSPHRRKPAQTCRTLTCEKSFARVVFCTSVTQLLVRNQGLNPASRDSQSNTLGESLRNAPTHSSAYTHSCICPGGLRR
jgi:hypothetical protein